MTFSIRLLTLLLRVLIITALALGLSYTYYQTDLIVTPIMFGLFIILAALELLWTLQRQERTWLSFLESVKYQDFNRVYQKQSSRELTEAYELITQSMEELQSSREAEFQLLQTVLKHVSVGVACYTATGNVKFTNTAFEELLDLKALVHIDKLQVNHPKIHQVMTTSSAAPVEWIDHKNGKKLFIRTEKFKLKGQDLKLVSLADIRGSLEAKEIESYQKLMRVMTHEIMNSATPILSLIKVVNKKLIHGEELISLEGKDQRNVAKSLQAIKARTEGILKFVEAYKEINRPIMLHKEPIKSDDLLSGIYDLVAPGAKVELTVSDSLQDNFSADKGLLTQVLINLIRNALEAVTNIEGGKVQLLIQGSKERIVIEVIDNGPGVKPENIAQIFTPFFTTKPTGSGIGLALSRKVVRAHGGTLDYKAYEDQTCFSISLPKA